MLDKLKEISNLKEQFIEERKNVLSSKVSAIQKALYQRLFDKILAALDTEKGRIINNSTNINLTSVIDKIFKDFETDLAKAMKNVTSDYNALIKYNEDYFSQYNTSLFNSVKKSVTEAMQARAGYDSKGFQKDGFIDSFIKDKTVARQVKDTVLSAVLNGTPITDLTKSLNTSLTGTADAPGAIDNHFKTFIYDTYSQFDAETGNQFAVQLDLNYALYQGGLVAATRPFCKERNGKVFTRKEIQAFGTSRDKFGGYTNKSKGEFAGKNKNYIPERDRGGYNCGHLYQWVDYTIAKSIRPDIQKQP